jgi:predicted RNA-binding protein YlxR (DUF448 family)
MSDQGGKTPPRPPKRAPRGGPNRVARATEDERDPLRTCIATRAELPRDELVRLVGSPDGEVVLDVRGKLPGRGAWLAPTAEALQRLERSKARVERDLGARLDVAAIAQALRDATVRGVREGLSMGAASGALILGRDVLERALLDGRVGLVAVASDCAERTSSALEDAAGGEAEFVPVPLTTVEIGHLVGRGLVAAVGVPDSGVTRWLQAQLRRLSVLG